MVVVVLVLVVLLLLQKKAEGSNYCDSYFHVPSETI